MEIIIGKLMIRIYSKCLWKYDVH